jgi:hypothetical protein
MDCVSGNVRKDELLFRRQPQRSFRESVTIYDFFDFAFSDFVIGKVVFLSGTRDLLLWGLARTSRSVAGEE